VLSRAFTNAGPAQRDEALLAKGGDTEMTETATTDLVMNIGTVPVVADRTAVQASDGQDSGETKDPPPRET
jgi:hypothetical protein